MNTLSLVGAFVAVIVIVFVFRARLRSFRNARRAHLKWQELVEEYNSMIEALRNTDEAPTQIGSAPPGYAWEARTIAAAIDEAHCLMRDFRGGGNTDALRASYDADRYWYGRAVSAQADLSDVAVAAEQIRDKVRSLHFARVSR